MSMKPITTVQHLHTLIETWKPRLGLDLWDIELNTDLPVEEGSIFEVNRSTAYERAVLAAAPWLFGKSTDKPDDILDVKFDDVTVERMLVHELLHCTVVRMSNVWHLVLDPPDNHLLTLPVREVVSATKDKAEEEVVDKLARSLVFAFGVTPQEKKRK